MSYVVIEFLAKFLELVVGYLVVSSVFRNEKKMETIRLNCILPFIGGIVAMVLCNKTGLGLYGHLSFGAVYLILSAKIIYKARVISILAIVGVYLLCMHSFVSLLVTLTYSLFGGVEWMGTFAYGINPIRSIAISLIKLVWIGIYLLLRTVIVKINNKGISIVFLTSGFGLFSFVFMSDQTIGAINQTMPAFWLVYICLLVFLMFAVYYHILRQEEKHKVEMLEMRNELLWENYNGLNEIYMSNAKLYHDLNNHLNVLYQLLDAGKTKEAQAYIQEISKPILQLSKTEWTGVDVVDVVINSKLQKLQELGIASDFNVEFPHHSNLLPNDLCTILANLLDNAIEAVMHLKTGRKIQLTIRRVNYFLFIRVVNPSELAYDATDLPKTTKENKIAHGWGLKNVCDAVERYGGTAEFHGEDGTFIANVMLPFEEV